MGLDGVELVLAWEAAFGIDIPDPVAERLRTPNDAIDHIYAQLPHADAPACLTRRAFFTIRRAVVATLGVRRASVTPATRLAELLPSTERRLIWANLQAASTLADWPDLVRSSWISNAVAGASLIAGLGIVGAGAGFGWATAAAFVTLIVGLRLTWPLRAEIPRHLTTLGGLAGYAALHNGGALLSPQPGWIRVQVRELVRAIIVEELGVPPDFDDHAEFVRDLGVD